MDQLPLRGFPKQLRPEHWLQTNIWKFNLVIHLPSSIVVSTTLSNSVLCAPKSSRLVKSASSARWQDALHGLLPAASPVPPSAKP